MPKFIIIGEYHNKNTIYKIHEDITRNTYLKKGRFANVYCDSKLHFIPDTHRRESNTFYTSYIIMYGYIIIKVRLNPVGTHGVK